MRVSIIITCHNYGDLVAGAINSAFAQDYPCNVIVIDDGSEDNSWEKIQEAAKRHPDLQAVHIPDQRMGPAWCKNWAMQTCWDTSDAFAFLDADDSYLPTKVSKSVALLKQDYAKVGLVYSDEHVNKGSKITETGVLNRGSTYFKEPFSLEAIATHNIVGGNYVVSRAAIKEMAGFDETMKVAEDYDLSRKLVEKYVLLHIPEPLVVRNITTRALSHSVPAAEWDYFNRRVANKYGKITA
jgi:glycosyltransferase involved in cell wall biosynthesis